ncbi:MAG TPA: ABC transporter permease [Gemmatimonadales bacterium]|nr:ABC transporter permease [Gemmatimonadales bacterium]
MILGELGRRLHFLLHRERFREELEEEMRLHQELRGGDNRSFGNPGLIQEQSRDVWGARWLDTLGQDLHYGIRTLRKNPGFTATAVLILAVAIGANTAVFSVVSSILLRPFPFAQQDRLVTPAEQDRSGALRPASYPTFLDWQTQSSAFSGLAFIRGGGWRLTTADGAQYVVASAVTPGFFDILGERPLLGRVFTPDEERSGAHVVVLSYGLWQDRLGGDPKILGKNLSLAPGVFTVVGVLPHDAAYPPWTDDQLYAPLESVRAYNPALSQRGFHADSWILGRLKDGITLKQATADLDGVALRLASAYPEWNADWSSTQLTPIRSAMLGNVQPQLVVLEAAVGLVLLIGCVNVAGLTLARAGARRRELAIRAALGAGRGRVVRQLLTESVMLAGIGGTLGVVLAYWAVALLRPVANAAFPRGDVVRVDGWVLAFSAAVTLVVSLLVGLAPALRAVRPGLTNALKDGARGSGAGRGRQRLHASLVTGEIALAMVLVVGAGLLVRSLLKLSAVNPGFAPDHLIVLSVSPPGSTGPNEAAIAAFYQRIENIAAALPGVARTGMTNFAPLVDGGLPSPVEVAGRVPDPKHDPQVLFQTVSPGYFAAMEIPVLKGRAFVNGDLAGGPVVIVNEAFAKAFWPGQDPIGRSLVVHKAAQGRSDFGAPMSASVVGVVGSVHHFALGTPPEPQVYVPFTRNPWGHMTLVVRTAVPPATLVPTLREAIRAIDPELAITGALGLPALRIMDVTAGLASRRLDAGLLGAFAASALLLAAIGLYGLLGHVVTQRRREIGVRVALGASRDSVFRLVVGDGMRLVLIGVAIGAVGALALTRLLAGLLFGVGAGDPTTFALVAVVLVLIALIACSIPARRAAGADPIQALRSE